MVPSRRKAKFSIGVLSCGARCYFLMCVLSRFSHVWLCATLWTVAHQASLSMGILQARILKWVAMPSSRGLSSSRKQTQAFWVLLHFAGGFLTTSSTWEALLFVLRKSVNWCLYSHCLTCHTFLHALHFLAYVYNIFEILKKSMRFLPTSMRKIQMCINCDVLISLFLKCRTIY